MDDPFVADIVKGWAGNFTAARAKSLGFKAETSFDEIIKVYQQDELGQ